MFKISVIEDRSTRFRAVLAAFVACTSLLGVVASSSTATYASPAAGTWTQQLTGPNIEARDFSSTDANHIWASGSYGRVMRTTDGGQNWSVSIVSDPVMVMQGIKFVNNQVGWIAGEWASMGILFRSTDGGVTWQRQNEPSGQRIAAVEALDPQTVMVVGGGTYFAITRRSTDGGVTWSDMPVPLNDSMFLDIFFLDHNNGWVTGLNGGIAHTTDGGVTWQRQNAPPTLGLERIHFSDPNNGWAGGYYGALLHTTDGGATWVVQNPVLPDYTHVLGVAAVSPSVAWISGYGGGAQSRPFVKKSTNGGASWVDYTPAVGPYDGFNPVMFLDEENGWAGGHAGIFRRIGDLPPSTSTPTFTPAATFTASATPAQSTPTATATTRATSSPTTVSTGTATATATAPAATPSATFTSVATQPAGTATQVTTAVASRTSTRTSTPEAGTPTAQPTAGQNFSDVAPTDYFYTAVNRLASRGIISGYADGTFRPYNNTTRGQLSKIVVLAQGWPIDTTGGPHFTDVPTTHPFYGFVETAYSHGIISGYSDGTFRAGNDVTRGQLSKIVVAARGWAMDTTGGPHFSDVPTTNAFYAYVETAYNHGIISGYSDGTFRVGSNATRGQIARIVYNALNGQP